MGVWINSPFVIEKQIQLKAIQDTTGFWTKLKTWWMLHRSQILQITLDIVSIAVTIILKNPAILGLKTSLTPIQQAVLDGLCGVLKQGTITQVTDFHNIITA